MEREFKELTVNEADLKSPSFQIVQRIAQAIGVKLSKLVKPLDNQNRKG